MAVHHSSFRSSFMFDPTPHLEQYGSYEHAYGEFRWQIPEPFNIAALMLSRHPDAVTRVALIEARPGGHNTYTYGGLDYLSDKFATVLKDRGLRRADPIAVILPQSAASMIAQLAALKLGAVVVPLSPRLEASALQFALEDCGARAVVIHHTVRERLSSIISPIEAVFTANKLGPAFEDISPDRDFWREVFEASADFNAADTDANSPAFFFYHATGDGERSRATHRHASLLYQLPAFEMGNRFQLVEDSKFWIPGDWDCVDSSLCSLYPALWYGGSIVACEAPLRNADAWSLIERCEVTHLFASVDEIDGLRQSSSPIQRNAIHLSNIVVTKPPQSETCDWAQNALGASVNTLFCDSMFGALAASCSSWYETPRGASGRPLPGYRIEIVDGAGRILPPRNDGRLAIRRTEQRPADQPAGGQAIDVAGVSEDWFVSANAGFKDEEGNLWLSRADAG